MSDAFTKAMDLVFAREGGYVNDPDDPGGETKFGISRAAYPNLDIAGLTQDDARSIYREDYWEAAHCDELPQGIDLAVFDMAVNHGVGAAIRALQRAAGTREDAIFGPMTAAAVRSCVPHRLLVNFGAQRALDYAAIAPEDLERFGYGWYRRLLLTHNEAVRLMASPEAYLG